MLREIAKASRNGFLVEAEGAESAKKHIFPRHYEEIFTGFGARQLAEYKVVPGLSLYTGRIFDTSMVE